MALLFDISGSMDVNDRYDKAREQGYFLLSGLRNGEDEAAIFAFDSRLHVIQPFTTELDRLRGTVTEFSRWGMTSHPRRHRQRQQDDGHAGDQAPGAGRAHRRHRHRQQAHAGGSLGHRARASTCRSTSSRSCRRIDDPRRGGSNQALAGELADLARWTGGQLFVATSTSEASAVARQIVDELRQQYLIAFEPGATPGWHAVDVRVRRKGHTVQARSGYVAGAVRPVS